MARTPVSFLATDSPDASQAFYAGQLGLELVASSPYALVFDDGGHMLRVQIVPQMTAQPFTVYGWAVSDITKTMRDLHTMGVEFQRFDGLPQDDMGVWTTPDHSKIAWFKDPCGNILSLTEFSR